MKSADLHLHTIFSDGTYTPQDLVTKAKENGLDCIAVADHDTVSGIAPSLEAGEASGLEVLPAIELTAEYQGLEIHILGYLIDYLNNNLLERLGVLKINRIQRVHKIVSKLNGLGINLEAEDVFALSGAGTVGRLHVARAMRNRGFINSTAEAFYKYIGEKCPAYVLDFRLSPAEAISLIKAAGGVAVLAHPYVLHQDELIPKLVTCGIMGLEVYYPEHSPPMQQKYKGLAEKYNLLITGGSDCHGDAKPEAKLGSVKVPYELVEKIKSAREFMK